MSEEEKKKSVEVLGEKGLSRSGRKDGGAGESAVVVEVVVLVRGEEAIRGVLPTPACGTLPLCSPPTRGSVWYRREGPTTPFPPPPSSPSSGVNATGSSNTFRHCVTSVARMGPTIMAAPTPSSPVRSPRLPRGSIWHSFPVINSKLGMRFEQSSLCHNSLIIVKASTCTHCRTTASPKSISRHNSRIPNSR